MIHWKEAELNYTDAQKSRWRKHVCQWATRNNGTCLGVCQGSFGDDEPHDICKACDMHEFGWKLVSAE